VFANYNNTATDLKKQTNKTKQNKKQNKKRRKEEAGRRYTGSVGFQYHRDCRSNTYKIQKKAYLL